MFNLPQILTDVKPFIRFGQEHWNWIFFSIIYTFFWIYLGKKQKTLQNQQKIGIIFSMISIICWFVMTYAHIFWDPVYANDMRYGTILPFHLCYFLNFMLLFLHVWRSPKVFDTWYPWVMAACFQALITADLDESFPHYYNLRYFIVHSTLVLHVLYGAIVYRFRPDFVTPVRALTLGLYYFSFVHVVNLLFGGRTNFMYTFEKPKDTILDIFGDYWLWKSIIVLFILFYVVCSPFYIMDYLKKRKNA
jgi:hypothetical integral membrane protein (TIGR02206 family)